MPRVITQITVNAYGINVLDLPGYSQDLNAIEEVWNVKEKKCESLEKNKMELWEGICRALYSLSRQRLMKLYDGMPERVMAVYKAKGGSNAN